MKKLRISIVLFAALTALCGCQQEKLEVAQAVLGSISELSFPAQGAETQYVRVVSDAPWTLQAPDWVLVSPSSGTGDTEVEITVEDNMLGGAMDEPRTAKVIFGGNTLASQFVLTVKQEGDAYRNAVRATVSDLGGLDDGKAMILENATVMALSSAGGIITDGTTNAYVSGLDKPFRSVVTIRGFAGKVNGMPAVKAFDDVTVTTEADIALPEPADITETIGTYPASAIEYVTVSGEMGLAAGGGYEVVVALEDRTYSAYMYEAPASLDVPSLNGHNVKVSGYSLGKKGELSFNLIPVEIVDEGVNFLFFFQDDFSWLAPFVAASGAGDSVGKSADDNAKNVYTATGLGEEFLAEVVKHGYEDLFPSAKVIYLQDCYLKFSKNKNVGGLRLPPMDFQGATAVELSFDWSVHVGGGGPDDVMLAVEIEGEGVFENGTKISDPVAHTMKKEGWADGPQKWSWKTETFKISGVNNDTRFKIRPTTFTGAATSSDLYCRWYLDNILVVPGEGFTPTPPTPPAGGVEFPVLWSFKDVGEDWVEGVDFKLLQPTGSWVMSDTHDGKITLNRASSTASSTLTYKNEGDIGVRLLTTGFYKDDYWLLEVDGVENPAGTYGVTFSSCSSAAGPKFFVLEYSTDGSNWTAINTKTTSETMTNATATTRDVTYTYALSYTSNTANEVLTVEESFHMPAVSGKLLIRARVCDTMALKRDKELNGPDNGGTTRIGRKAEITFTAD